MLSNKKVSFNLKLLIFIIICLNISIIYFFSFNRLYLNLGQNLEIFLKEPVFIDQKNNKKIILNNLLESTINRFAHNNKFESLSIDLSFQNYQKLKKNRLNSLKQSFLVREKLTKAKINYQNKIYDAKIRLKGDTKQHWYLPKQWSLKIELLNGQSILGMKNFAITRHSARSYPLNIVVSKTLSNLGMLTPEYGNIYVEINGQNWGLMHFEELPSNAYIERKKNTYNNFFKIGSENYWKDITLLSAKMQKTDSHNLDLLFNWQDRLNINFYSKKDFNHEIGINRSNYLRRTYEKILLNLINEDEIGQYLDLNSFSIALINSFILGEIHSLDLPNSRYYFNPYSLKIEIIPNDFGEIKELKYNDSLPANLDSKRIRLLFYEKIIFSQKFLDAYIKNLDLFSNYSNEFKNYTDIFCKEFNSACRNKYSFEIINKNTEIILSKREKQIYELQNFFLQKKQKLENLSFNSSAFINIDINNYIGTHIYSNLYSNGIIQFFNTTPFNIEIKKISLFKEDCLTSCKKEHFFNNLIIQPSKFNKINFMEKNLNLNLKEYSNYEILTSLDSNKKVFRGKINNPEIHNIFSTKKFLENNEMFKISKNFIEIKKGNWSVKEPITIKNKDLIINEGTVIKFNSESFIHIINGNLLINQDSSIPENLRNNYKVILKAEKDYWKGIYVENETIKNASVLRNVEIQDTKKFSYGLYHLMGGLNFYKTKVEIDNLSFLNSYSEDQINFIKSEFIVKNSLFTDSFSDSIDSDFSTGEIINVNMSNVKGDAIDTSSSFVKLDNVKKENKIDISMTVIIFVLEK